MKKVSPIRACSFSFCFLLCFISLFASKAKSQWMQTPGITSTNISAFAVNGTSIFAGDTWPSSTGVYRSTNDGASWSAVNTGLLSLEIYSLLMSDTDLFAGTVGGLFRSSNKGASWVTSGLTNVGKVTALIMSGTNLIAGTFNFPTNSGVLQSNDHGATWKPINGSTDWKNLGVNKLLISGTYLLAGVSSVSDGGGGVMRSSDSGASWSVVSGLPTMPVYTLAALGSNLFAGIYGGGVYVSTDNGGNWVAVNSGLTGNDLFIEALAVSGSKLFASGNYGRVFVSDDNGTTWTSANTGFQTDGELQRLAVIGMNLYAGTSSGVWKRPLSEFGKSDVATNITAPPEIGISPNPTVNVVKLSRVPADARIEVTNVLGANIMKISNAGTGDQILDLSNLPAGSYYIHISSKNSMMIKMVIKE